MSKEKERKIEEKGEFMKKETVRLADGRYLIFYDFIPLPGGKSNLRRKGGTAECRNCAGIPFWKNG